MSRWIDLPIEDGEIRPRLFLGDEYRVRDSRGRIHETTYRGLGGFVDGDGEPVEAHAVEVSP